MSAGRPLCGDRARQGQRNQTSRLAGQPHDDQCLTLEESAGRAVKLDEASPSLADKPRDQGPHSCEEEMKTVQRAPISQPPSVTFRGFRSICWCHSSQSIKHDSRVTPTTMELSARLKTGQVRNGQKLRSMKSTTKP